MNLKKETFFSNPPDKFTVFSPDLDFNDALNFWRGEGFFGQILLSNDSFDRIIRDILSLDTKFPSIGTLFNLVIEYVKENGRIGFLLENISGSSPSRKTVIEFLEQILHQQIDSFVDYPETSHTAKMEWLSLAFQIRFALKHFIQVCQILKKYDALSLAEQSLNELDQRIYGLCRGGKIFTECFEDHISTCVSTPDFVKLCAWGVLSGSLPFHESKKAMSAASVLCDKSDKLIWNEHADILGLAAAAECVIDGKVSALKYLKRAFSADDSKKNTNFAWSFHVAINYVLGVKAEYYGLRLAPCLPGEWSEVLIKRMFRGKEFNIKITKTPGCESSKMFLNGEKYGGQMIHILDFKGKNRIELEIA